MRTAGLPDVLDRSCAMLEGCLPDVVAVDMPLSYAPIVGRREADRAISRTFGAAGASTHSPSRERPGPTGEALYRTLTGAGYRLATTSRSPGSMTLIEVYPHPAILRLMGSPVRLAYKVTRASKYWPTERPDERRRRLRKNMSALWAALRTRIVDLPRVLSAERLPKQSEDMLDAAVSGWVGIRYLEGRAEPYGDVDAAIWVPMADAPATIGGQ